MNLVEFVDVPCGVLGESRTICMPGIFAQRAFSVSLRIRRRFIVAQNSYRRRANRRRVKLKTLDYIVNRVYMAVPRSGIAGLTLGLHYLSFEAMREHAQDVAAVIDDIERLNCLQEAV